MYITKIRFTLMFVLSFLVTQTSFGSVATYKLTVTNDWTSDTHPINYPSDAHLSWLGGGTHDASQSFWKLGGVSSPGFERMAETGVTTDFVNQVAASGSPLEWQHWFCQPTASNSNCGSLSEEFTIDSSQPLITLASMLGPSPDWFVGVSGLSLQTGGDWVSSLNVPLALYDAGTEEGTTPVMSNPETSPLQPISLISYDGTTGDYLPSGEEYIVGAFTFELISVSEVPLPAAMWLFVSGLWGLVSYRGYTKT
jgi:hypothetical protein